MDLRTGHVYSTLNKARAAGVPDADLAELHLSETDAERVRRGELTLDQARLLAQLQDLPEVRFASGPFKDRSYKRNERGQLVRTDR